MFRTVSLSIIRSFSLYTQQWYMYIQCNTPDDGQRNYPEHVEFHSKNNFEKLVHLVDFIIRIYKDARSPERQNHVISQLFYHLQACGILELWKIKFVLPNCQNKYPLSRAHIFIKSNL